ncbi:hypothetical protein LXL04_013787 [Taraxacum kok-saghyz]
MRGSQLYTALFFPSLEFFPTGFSLANFSFIFSTIPFFSWPPTPAYAPVPPPTLPVVEALCLPPPGSFSFIFSIIPFFSCPPTPVYAPVPPPTVAVVEAFCPPPPGSCSFIFSIIPFFS